MSEKLGKSDLNNNQSSAQALTKILIGLFTGPNNFLSTAVEYLSTENSQNNNNLSNAIVNFDLKKNLTAKLYLIGIYFLI